MDYLIKHRWQLLVAGLLAPVVVVACFFIGFAIGYPSITGPVEEAIVQVCFLLMNVLPYAGALTLILGLIGHVYSKIKFEIKVATGLFIIGIGEYVFLFMMIAGLYSENGL